MSTIRVIAAAETPVPISHQCFGVTADHRIDHQQQHAAKQRADHKPDRLIAQPFARRLVHQPILPLAQIIGVERPRQAQRGIHRDEHQRAGQHPQPRPPAAPLHPVTHFGQ